ncbi:molybdopterin molybdenumtransferase MoeA [Sneathiella sp. P13V-1]|uniref:molybdopterin molybdotransferase MoeA n=1 Tax=Sneathiella sp. P13V-1 TaxID=2697366 RepID=UPI00187B30DD|nr:gephyrin-like molybdotransferase Glp [Sneathiella sp. P13V-1]MBE7637558.1 molybdopterin molybdenumtransferase MoeA [Sneathiella sp. P13V-1]
MISVEEALKNILSAIKPVSTETVSIQLASGRILAEPVTARRTQPPSDLSAMDGYAVKASDVAVIPAKLSVIGESAAGHGFEGSVGTGEAVRIFTGAPLPKGTDTIIIQEDTDRDGDIVTVKEGADEGRYVRRAGIDFREGEPALKAGKKLTPRDIGLMAAMNIPWVAVYRKPQIALLSTGDELVRPGEPLGSNQIISTNSLVVAAMIEQAGGEAIDLGIAADNEDSLRQMAQGAAKADMLVTLGGASVGDHDLVQSVLGKEGLQIDFWRIAMRPGKPLMFGDLAGTPMLGMPGNPVSSMICSYIFLIPALDILMGRAPRDPKSIPAILSHDVKQNDQRQDYLRAKIVGDQDGLPLIETFSNQDSSLLSALSEADCLLMRLPHADPLNKGQQVEILMLEAAYPDV